MLFERALMMYPRAVTATSGGWDPGGDMAVEPQQQLVAESRQGPDAHGEGIFGSRLDPF
jgi:hypothetical protein